jgi:hypothetical protein
MTSRFGYYLILINEVEIEEDDMMHERNKSVQCCNQKA